MSNAEDSHGAGDSTEKHGDVDFKDKLKHVWDKMNPVSPRAQTDLNILKGWTKADDHAKVYVKDSSTHPEINTIAEVRHGLDLCADEQTFVNNRKARMQEHFAKYMGLDPADVHPDDIPTVALGGSGGGFRAMIGMLAYSSEMRESGLWDLLMYIAGVSGSCWAIAAYYTFGDHSWNKVIEHCKQRFGVHPLSDDAIRAVLSSPDGVDTAFGPLEVKTIAGLHVVPMDYYSVLTSCHIFLHHRDQRPSNTSDPGFDGFKPSWFKYSSVGAAIQSGTEPLPILTAVRHERPWKDWTDAENPFADPDYDSKEHASQDAWFQWYEMTPYEIGCDELGAWVPTWGFGRPFSSGKSTMQLPEHSLALLLGLCTSAPAGSMDSYIATLRRNLPGGVLGATLKDAARRLTSLWGKHGTDVFAGHHPLHACNEHNFLFHLTEDRPPGLQNSPRIHLIDSGMDNNCPTYVLLHPARKVDVILNMDASSDVARDQQGRLDQIGGRRGLKLTKRAEGGSRYAHVYDGETCERPATVVDSYGKTVATPPAPVVAQASNMVYMPLLGNEEAAPGFDPTTSSFSSSYNLVWTPEQVQTLVDVCRANFRAAEPTIKEVLREQYEKKKASRLGKGAGP